MEIVEKTHPNLQLFTFAYFGTLDAPKDMDVHKNLWINVVSSSTSANSAGDQMGPIQNNPANYEYERAIRDWPKRAPGRVVIWHWDTYRSEWPSMFYVQENMRLMHEAGVYAVNPQVTGGPWGDLLNWLYMKLSWNIDADADALIYQYLEHNFSEAAAPHLWNYLKRGQKAYEDSLHLPSAVRWSGWTLLTMNKIFHEVVREDLVALMDQAEAAVMAHGSEQQQADFLSKRREAIDQVVLESAALIGDWGMVRNARDGRNWYVPGANPHMPELLHRLKRAQNNKQAMARFIRGQAGDLRFYGGGTYRGEEPGRGGPVVELAGGPLHAGVVPDLSGQVVSARLSDDGRELFDATDAAAGYMDVFEGVHTQLWLPLDGDRASLDRNHEEWVRLWSDFKNPHSHQLHTELILSDAEFATDHFLHRSVKVDNEGLTVERRYTGDPAKGGSFDTRWRLALPDPRQASVGVSGGSIQYFMDLSQLEIGEVEWVEGERPPGYEGADWMTEEWDMVYAVSHAEETELEVDGTDELVISLDRGDGVAVRIHTPAEGWAKVRLLPLVDENALEIILVGRAPEADGPVEGLKLPSQKLTTREVPLVERAIVDDKVEPRIEITGEGRAVNLADGAELVWVPEGTFIRSSEHPVAGSDEQPVREIHLDGYWIYKYPVTVGQYKAYRDAIGEDFRLMWALGPSYRGLDPDADVDDYMVFTNWFDAQAYAESVGGSLPTEAEWEKAARGTDAREFPWGNEWDSDRAVSMENTWHVFYEDRFTRGFRPVQTLPEGASPYGARHMAGNGWEWTHDWYRHTYYEEAPSANPPGPAYGNLKSVRGGTSLYDWRFSRTAARMAVPPTSADWTPIGFRPVIRVDADPR